MSMQWQTQLEGDIRDLEYSAKIFEAGPRRVLRDRQGAGYLYESDAFSTCTTSEEVEGIAKDELSVLSGILKLERGASDNLRYGAVFGQNQNGGRDIFLRIQSVQASGEIGAVTVTVNDASGNEVSRPVPPLRSVVLLQLAITNPAIAKVMRLLSAADVVDWVGLYRIHEVIELDVGGEDRLKKQEWISANNLKRFKHSANSVQVGGDQSRHGKEPNDPPKNPMTVIEAKAYVKDVVQAWLATKGA